MLMGEETLQTCLSAAARDPRATALFCDIDGTISPIVADPDAAEVPTEFRTVLATLAQHLGLLAFVTGRELAEGREMIDVAGAAYVGQHGFETMDPGGTTQGAAAAEPYVAAVQESARRAEQLAGRLPGLIIQNKRLMFDIHYRKAADPVAALGAIEDEIVAPARAAGLAVATGHFVVEVLPPLPMNKGTAVQELLGAHPQIVTALVFGDDLTDTTAFVVVREWAAKAPERLACAVAALTEETPEAVRKTSDVWVAATPGVLAALKQLLTAVGG
jgi:trehalose-phosphatase